MLHVAEPIAPPTRWLYDIGKLALLSLVLVPIYLLVNEFWQSILRLVALYGLLVSEDNALVLGSLLLFAILAAIMLITRKIDWYALGQATPPPVPAN